MSHSDMMRKYSPIWGGFFSIWPYFEVIGNWVIDFFNPITSIYNAKARHNGNGNEFRCSTPGYNAAIWLKLDSVNFAESNLLKNRFHRKNSL